MDTNKSGLNTHNIEHDIDHGHEYYIRGVASVGRTDKEKNEPSIRKPAIPYDYKDPSNKVKPETLAELEVRAESLHKRVSEMRSMTPPPLPQERDWVNPPPIPQDSKNFKKI
ncbi:MAG: hypothetical protein PHQ18_05035 [Patescibacteria group bacterium]|nr:hypothetical protein [Patescibacteria group bacterium]